AVHISSDGGTPPSSRGVGITSSSTSKWALVPMRDATNGCFVYFFTYQGVTVSRLHIDTVGDLLGQENVAVNVDGFAAADVGNGLAIAFSQFVTTTRKVIRVQRFGLDGTAQFPGVGTLVSREEGTAFVSSAFPFVSATGVTMLAFSDTRYNRPTNP